LYREVPTERSRLDNKIALALAVTSGYEEQAIGGSSLSNLRAGGLEGG
jgi:hypothetical protein